MSILNFKEYTFCITDASNGETKCKNPRVVFFTGDAQARRCEDRPGCVTIKVPEGTDACVTGEVICDDCGSCPSKPFTICPCDTHADCDVCERCVNGMCVSLCDGLCQDGQCVDCTSNDDCAFNQICTNGKCQCENGLVKNERGECVNCLNGDYCEPCQECFAGECIVKDCGGACNPVTGECVECLNSGNCQGRADNRSCCIGNECACCDGYIYDLATNICVPEPDCILDTDCEECEHCIGGVCVEIPCPEGTICIAGECVTVCDCSEPTCSRSSACVQYNVDTCICIDCNVACANGICPEGCYCKDGVTCAPNPCNASCTTGAECGFGCGCKDGKCIPCESSSCADCAEIDGCNCRGGVCAADPCKAPCSDGSDCGPNCGCMNGTCVSCDVLDCSSGECIQALGCECVNNSCTKRNCDKSCKSSHDCDLGCTCVSGDCIPCANYTCNDCNAHLGCACTNGTCEGVEVGCDNEDFVIDKIGATCDLKATLSGAECCSCENIETKAIYKSDSVGTTLVLSTVDIPTANQIWDISLLRGAQLLGSTGIQNELPTLGRLNVSISYTKNVNNSSLETVIGTPVTVVFDGTIVDTKEISFAGIPIPGTYVQNGNSVIISNVTITVDQITDFEFPNECKYIKENDPVVESKLSSTTGAFTKGSFSGEISSEACRTPIISWYWGISENNINSLGVMEYATSENGNFVSYIEDCADYLYSGYWYEARGDCNCSGASNKIQALFCEAVEEFEITVSPCGNDFTVTSMFLACDINKLLDPACLFPLAAQVEWLMVVNGVETERFILDDDSNPPLNQTYSAADSGAITSVKLTHSHDPSCSIERTAEAVDVITVDVNTDTCPDALVTVTKGIVPIVGCTVNLLDISNNPVVAPVATDVNGQVTFAGLTKDVVYTITVDCVQAGCPNYTTSITLTGEDCCASGTGDLLTSYVNGILQIQPSAANATLTYTYSIKKGTDPIVLLGSMLGGNFSVSQALINGDYVVSGIDDVGCDYLAVPPLTVDECANINIQATVTFDATFGSEKIDVTNITGSTAPYTVELLDPLNVVISTQTGVAASTSFNASLLLDQTTYKVKITDAQIPACNSIYEILVDKQQQCDIDPIDLTLTPEGSPDCNEALYGTLWVTNGVGAYTITIKNSFGNTVEQIANLGTGTFLTYLLTDGAGRDQYSIANTMGNDTYTFEIVDSRNCSDMEDWIVGCACDAEILTDIQGAVCLPDQTHEIRITDITGGDTGVYQITVHTGDTCDALTYLDGITTSTFPAIIPIPTGAEVAAPGQYYVTVTDGENCTTNCIAVEAPECAPVVSCVFALGTWECAGEAEALTISMPITNDSLCDYNSGDVTINSIVVNGINVTGAFVPGNKKVVFSVNITTNPTLQSTFCGGGPIIIDYDVTINNLLFCDCATPVNIIESTPSVATVCTCL